MFGIVRPAGTNITKYIIVPFFITGLLEFFKSINQPEENPNYLVSLNVFNLKGTAKWKLIPFGLLQSYLALAIIINLLLYMLTWWTYIQSTKVTLATLQ